MIVMPDISFIFSGVELRSGIFGRRQGEEVSSEGEELV